MAEPEITQERRGALERFAHHQRNALEATGKAIAGLVPHQTRAQSRRALREHLLALRSLIDGAIDTLDPLAPRGSAPDGEPSTGVKKVKIKVE